MARESDYPFRSAQGLLSSVEGHTESEQQKARRGSSARAHVVTWDNGNPIFPPMSSAFLKMLDEGVQPEAQIVVALGHHRFIIYGNVLDR